MDSFIIRLLSPTNMLRKFSLIAFALLSLCEAPLMGGWSTPPEIVYPSSAPENATYPFIATDSSGHSVAVWFDTTGSGSMQAATLAAGAVNGSGQPNWIVTNPIATSNVLSPSSAYAQAVGMDSSGNSVAVWTDGTYVYVSKLSLGQTTWSSPTVISTPLTSQVVTNLYIAVAPNGSTIVTWMSALHPYDGAILANVFDPTSQLWRGQTAILGTDIKFDLASNQVAIDPQGNAVVTTIGTSNNLQAVSYNFSGDDWTLIPSIATNPIVFEYTAVDLAGNATLVWIEQDNSIHAAMLPLNQTSLINSTILSLSADTTSSPPLVAIDSSGNAVAVWPDATGGLASARYSFFSAAWTPLPVLDLGGNLPYNISFSVDAHGNAVASWTTFLSSTSYIQSAALGVDDSVWKFLTQLSPDTDVDNDSQIILTSDGNAISVWENDINGSAGTINSANYLGMFALPPTPSVTPKPPSYFRGKIVRHRHHRKIDRIRKIKWGASSDMTVVKYRVYRNSKLIATRKVGHRSFIYNDRYRHKWRKDTYKIVSVNANGAVSTPLYVKLK